MTELTIRTGLLPYLSESRPSIGPKRNWNNEKEAMTAPTRIVFPPELVISNGRIGITIPNPIRSMKTTNKRVSNFLFMDILL